MRRLCTCCGDPLAPEWAEQLRCSTCALAIADLPVAYYVRRSRFDRRWYPMRFGAYRLNARHERIGFATLQEAVWYCVNEQLDYQRRWPAPSDGGAA